MEKSLINITITKDLNKQKATIMHSEANYKEDKILFLQKLTMSLDNIFFDNTIDISI